MIIDIIVTMFIITVACCCYVLLCVLLACLFCLFCHLQIEMLADDMRTRVRVVIGSGMWMYTFQSCIRTTFSMLAGGLLHSYGHTRTRLQGGLTIISATYMS